jgi:hypothetical protein
VHTRVQACASRAQLSCTPALAGRALHASNWAAIEPRAGAFAELWGHCAHTAWYKGHPHLQVSSDEIARKALQVEPCEWDRRRAMHERRACHV